MRRFLSGTLSALLFASAGAGLMATAAAAPRAKSRQAAENVTPRMEGATALLSIGGTLFKFEYRTGGLFVRSLGHRGESQWQANEGTWYFKDDSKSWICAYYPSEGPKYASCNQFLKRGGRYYKAHDSNPNDPMVVDSLTFK
jgi:hypothetical protein